MSIVLVREAIKTSIGKLKESKRIIVAQVNKLKRIFVEYCKELGQDPTATYTPQETEVVYSGVSFFVVPCAAAANTPLTMLGEVTDYRDDRRHSLCEYARWCSSGCFVAMGLPWP